jgi:outer membrane protein assembly factor BamB
VRTYSNKATVALVIVTISVLSGCGLFSSKSGPQMAPLADFKPTVDIKTLWDYRVGGAGNSVLVPAVVGNVVYVASQDGRIARLEGGREVWRIETKQSLSGGVTADGKLIIVGTRHGDVLAYAAVDGALRWKAKASSEVIAPAALTSQGALVRTGDNTLALFSLADGKRLWIYTPVNPPLALRSNAAPVVAEPYAFVGLPGGKITGISLQNGALVWEGAVTLPKGTTELERVADVVSSPMIDGRQTCAVAYQGRIACFDVVNGGSLSWAREMSSTQNLSADGRNVYVSDDRNTLHALDRETGSPIWKNNQFLLRKLSAPLAVTRRGLVAAGDVQGYVHFFSREDGSFAARIKTDGSPILAQPQLLGNSTVLVQTRDGGIFALEIQ